MGPRAWIDDQLKERPLFALVANPKRLAGIKLEGRYGGGWLQFLLIGIMSPNFVEHQRFNMDNLASHAVGAICIGKRSWPIAAVERQMPAGIHAGHHVYLRMRKESLRAAGCGESRPAGDIEIII